VPGGRGVIHTEGKRLTLGKGLENKYGKVYLGQGAHRTSNETWENLRREEGDN